MKRQIKKITLFVIAILGVNCANAQTDFSIHLGMLFPQGNFAESRMDNGDVAWLTKSNRAGVGLGFDAGIKFRFNVPSVKGLGIIATADFFLNTPNDDVKYWKEDTIGVYREFNDDYIGEIETHNISLPYYINIPIMVGLNYEYGIDDNIKIWIEGALGLNIGTLTNYEISTSGTIDYHHVWGTDYDLGKDYYFEITQKYYYKTNVNLAFQLGAGFIFNDKYSLGVYYYELGSQRIKGVVEEESYRDYIDYGTISSINESIFKYKSINPSIFTIRLGYHF